MDRTAHLGVSQESLSVPTPCITVTEVTKTFDGTHALEAVSFTINRGEIHALLGANGAGKSTLIKILSGFYRPDGGTIEVTAGSDPSGPGGKVSFIHQDLALVGNLTVAENVALLRGFPKRRGRISWMDVRRQAVNSLDLVGGGIDVDSKVNELSRADQSLVAIARALSEDCCAVVLDEPTASLPEADVERLFAILGRLKQSGVSVLYVTHRLDEVRKIADHVTILRDGKVVTDADIQAISDKEIITAIVGGAVAGHVRRDAATTRSAVLQLDSARITAGGGTFELQVAHGEVLGLAGLRGAGHEEVGRALAGIDPLFQAALALDGKPTHFKDVRHAIRAGIGFATSRREEEALAMTLTVRENFFINPGAMKAKRRLTLSRSAERTQAARLSQDVHLRPASPEANVATFSGGNQQKVILGRWLSVDLKVLILEEPTMGIDVGARSEIYPMIDALAAQGLAVLVISSDFEELATVCDRVLVFDRGQILVELRDEDITVDALTHHASGAQKAAMA